MLDTAILLQKTPKRALVEIINYHNDTLLEESKVSFTDITPVEGRKTKVTLSSLDAPNALYSGSTDFIFNRLDLTEFFQPVSVDVQLFYPSNTQAILSKLATMFGMVMNEQDFIIEEINQFGQQTYTLKAKSSSLRWYGQVDINITVSTNLEEYLNITVLDGLNQFSGKTPLENLYQIVVLNGLVYGDVGLNIASFFTQANINGLWTIEDGILVDVTGTGLQMLKEAISDTSTPGLTPNDYYFSLPSANNVGDWNSKVTLTASGYNPVIGGQVELLYNRFDFETVLAAFNPPPITGFPETTDVLVIINNALGINLQYTTTLVTELEWNVFNVKAKSNNLGYFNEAIITIPVDLPENTIYGFNGEPISFFSGDPIGYFETPA